MSILKPKKSKKGVLITVAAVGSALAAGATLLTTKKGKALLSNASKEVGKAAAKATSLLHSEEKQARKVIKRTPLKRTIKAVRKRAK